jgi:hypothetical protein
MGERKGGEFHREEDDPGLEWHLHHTAQAERLRRTLEALASHHEEQAASHSLEPAPPKKTDSRSKKWGAKPTYQLEALPPDVLAGMVDGEITTLFNREIFEADVAAQPGTRRTIAKQLPAADGAA